MYFTFESLSEMLVIACAFAAAGYQYRAWLVGHRAGNQDVPPHEKATYTITGGILGFGLGWLIILAGYLGFLFILAGPIY